MIRRRDWYRDFFRGVPLDFWRHIVPPEQTLAEADFLEAVLGSARRARWLDVPCGEGRHAIELARRGHTVVGVDVSEEALAEGRRASTGPGTVEWVRLDMRDLDGRGEFDGAYCFGNSFGYLEHADTVRFLDALARALRPKARLVLQSGMAAESILPNFVEREWHRAGGILVTIENRYLTHESCLETAFTFVHDGRVETRTAWHRVYTLAELRRLLVQVGLETVGLFATLDRQPFQLGSPLLLLVAERRG